MRKQTKPRCPHCKRTIPVTRHSIHRRPDGTTYSRWMCRDCGATFLQRADRRRTGNYRSKY